MPEHKTSERRLSALDKRIKALELKREGKGYREIAKEVGYRGPSGAHQAVMTALQETLQEPADALRRVESDRLDWLWREVVDRMPKDHLWAVDRALKIMERRASLFGLDQAPERDWGGAGASFLAGVETGTQMQAEDMSSQASE